MILVSFRFVWADNWWYRKRWIRYILSFIWYPLLIIWNMQINKQTKRIKISEIFMNFYFYFPFIENKNNHIIVWVMRISFLNESDCYIFSIFVHTRSIFLSDMLEQHKNTNTHIQLIYWLRNDMNIFIKHLNEYGMKLKLIFFHWI